MSGRARSTPVTPKMRVVIGAGRSLGAGRARPPPSFGDAGGATVDSFREGGGATFDTCRMGGVSPPAAAVTPGRLAIEATNEAGSGPRCRENSVSGLEALPCGGSVLELDRLADGEGDVGAGAPEGASVKG